MRSVFKAARVLTVAVLPLVPVSAAAQKTERNRVDSDNHQTITVTCVPTFSTPQAEQASDNKWVIRCRALNDQIFGIDIDAGTKPPEIISNPSKNVIIFKIDLN